MFLWIRYSYYKRRYDSRWENGKELLFTVYTKPSPNELGGDFFKVAHDSDLDSTFYTARYRANVKEANMKKIVRLHHPDTKCLYVSDTDDSQSSGEEKYFINIS